MVKEYEMFCHWKQGDDLSSYTSGTGDSAGGLIAWAQSFEENAKNLRRLAEIFDGKKLFIQADTHYFGLSGDKEALEKAEKEGLIYFIEMDYDEDYQDELRDEKSDACKKEHHCYNCRKKLEFYDFFHTDLYGNTEEKVLELWNNDNLNFFCCKCIDQLECNDCNAKLEPLIINDKVYLYYCPICLEKKFNLLLIADVFKRLAQTSMTIKGEGKDLITKEDAKELFLKKILELEDYLINMRQFKRDDKFIIKNQINGKVHNIYVDTDKRKATVKCLCGDVFYFNVEGSKKCPNCNIIVTYERK